MDEQLAEIYGTGSQEMEEDDLEKTASAELLVKLAEEEGIDLDSFSDDEIAGMIGDLQGETVEDESQTKLAEADYLGRVMAHSMVQELNDIEKTALSKVEIGMKARDLGSRGYAGLKKILKGEQWSAGKKQMAGAGRRAEKAAYSGSTKKPGVYQKVTKGGTDPNAARRLSERLKRNYTQIGKKKRNIGMAKTLGTYGAGAGALGLGAAGIGSALSKKGSALDKLAEDRAYDILAANGWVNEEGQVFEPEQGQEKVATQLDVAVESEALQMLESAGYPVEWND